MTHDMIMDRVCTDGSAAARMTYDHDIYDRDRYYRDMCDAHDTDYQPGGELHFRPMDYDALDRLVPLLTRPQRSRTCDATLAGMLMWAEYFRYEYAIVDNTLFVKGAQEDCLSASAFSFPLGDMPLSEAVAMLKEYCRSEGMPLRFSAVPADRVPELQVLGACHVDELVDWADYLYDAQDLATLSGNRYSKKRNHVNRFAADHPDASVVGLTDVMVPAVVDFLRGLPEDEEHITARIERQEVSRVLDHWAELPMEGAVLVTPTEGIVAFAIGEVGGDTLFVHIEKMNHHINGAGETINKEFARMMVERHGVAYVNREEDAGDEGLRRAKESYHPVMKLRKFNVEFQL